MKKKAIAPTPRISGWKRKTSTNHPPPNKLKKHREKKTISAKKRFKARLTQFPNGRFLSNKKELDRTKRTITEGGFECRHEDEDNQDEDDKDKNPRQDRQGNDGHPEQT
jgi:hypothetical protein